MTLPQFEVYCSNKYKFGDDVQKVQYKYLCNCNSKEHYIDIRNNFNRDYLLAKEMQKKERDRDRDRDRERELRKKIMENYNIKRNICKHYMRYYNLSNGNRFIKRSVGNTVLEHINFIRDAQNFFLS